MNETLKLSSLDDLDRILLLGREAIEAGPHEIHIKKIVNRRTLPQNAAIHKYCDIIANLMNEAGYTQRQLVGSFKEGFELPITASMIKDIIREVGRAMFGKESTADLTTVELQQVYVVVDARFGEITGIRAEFPSNDAPMIGRRK